MNNSSKLLKVQKALTRVTEDLKRMKATDSVKHLASVKKKYGIRETNYRNVIITLTRNQQKLMAKCRAMEAEARFLSGRKVIMGTPKVAEIMDKVMAIPKVKRGLFRRRK